MTTLFALFAEVERDLIAERTREGLAKARASGRKLGRPKKLAGRASEGKHAPGALLAILISHPADHPAGFRTNEQRRWAWTARGAFHAAGVAFGGMLSVPCIRERERDSSAAPSGPSVAQRTGYERDGLVRARDRTLGGLSVHERAPGPFPCHRDGPCARCLHERVLRVAWASTLCSRAGRCGVDGPRAGDSCWQPGHVRRAADSRRTGRMRRRGRPQACRAGDARRGHHRGGGPVAGRFEDQQEWLKDHPPGHNRTRARTHHCGRRGYIQPG